MKTFQFTLAGWFIIILTFVIGYFIGRYSFLLDQILLPVC